MNKIRNHAKTQILFIFFSIIFLDLLLTSCTESSVYLVPKETPKEESKAAGNFNVLIRPIYTSDLQSEDREKYRFDFSSHFTPIEIHFHNGTPDPVQWSPDKTILKDFENKEYKVLSEEEAFQYYKSGDSGGNEIVLLEKPYEQQKEDIETINRFMIKAASIPPGGDLTGLLLFKKIPLTNCDQVQLFVGGILIEQLEKSVQFSLKCPKS